MQSMIDSNKTKSIEQITGLFVKTLIELIELVDSAKKRSIINNFVWMCINQ